MEIVFPVWHKFAWHFEIPNTLMHSCIQPADSSRHLCAISRSRAAQRLAEGDTQRDVHSKAEASLPAARALDPYDIRRCIQTPDTPIYLLLYLYNRLTLSVTAAVICVQYRARQQRIAAQRLAEGDTQRDVQSKAEASFLAARALDPYDIRCYVSLGTLYVRQRRLADARRVFEEGCTVSQGANAYVWTALANLERLVCFPVASARACI